MKPTEILSQEHRLISRVLDCMGKMVERIREQGTLEGLGVRDLISFLRDFADHFHRVKEEMFLYPLMESKGLDSESGPIGTMLREHEQSHSLLQCMEQVLDDAEAGDAEAIRQFATYARAYLELRREHMMREDYTLFTMADRMLSFDDQHGMIEAFHKAETEDMQQTPEVYSHMADELAARYGLEPVEAASS